MALTPYVDGVVFGVTLACGFALLLVLALGDR